MTENFYGYEPPIEMKTRKSYEQLMRGVYRWKGLSPSSREENNMDHEGEMFGIDGGEVSWKCPILYSLLDHPIKGHMFYFHDGGEIITGDIPNDGIVFDQLPVKFQQRYKDMPPQEVKSVLKEKEHAVFEKLLHRYVDPAKKEEVVESYRRYCAKDPQDLEANYVDLIDKIQAIRFGAANVFPGKGMKEFEQQQRFNHVFELIRKASYNLVHILPVDAADEVRRFVLDEIDRLGRTGYKKSITEEYKKKAVELMTVQDDTIQVVEAL